MPPCNGNSDVLLSKVTQKIVFLMCPLLLTQTEFLIAWLFCSKKNWFFSWYITIFNELVPWEHRELSDLNIDIFQMRSLMCIYLDLGPMQALRFFCLPNFHFWLHFLPIYSKNCTTWNPLNNRWDNIIFQLLLKRFLTT